MEIFQHWAGVGRYSNIGPGLDICQHWAGVGIYSNIGLDICQHIVIVQCCLDSHGFTVSTMNYLAVDGIAIATPFNTKVVKFV